MNARKALAFVIALTFVGCADDVASDSSPVSNSGTGGSAGSAGSAGSGGSSGSGGSAGSAGSGGNAGSGGSSDSGGSGGSGGSAGSGGSSGSGGSAGSAGSAGSGGSSDAGTTDAAADVIMPMDSWGKPCATKFEVHSISCASAPAYQVDFIDVGPVKKGSVTTTSVPPYPTTSPQFGDQTVMGPSGTWTLNVCDDEEPIWNCRFQQSDAVAPAHDRWYACMFDAYDVMESAVTRTQIVDGVVRQIREVQNDFVDGRNCL